MSDQTFRSETKRGIKEGQLIEAVPGVNIDSEPFVHLSMAYGPNRERAVLQMTPAEAREIASSILQVAEASETDAYLTRFFKERMGLDDTRMLATLLLNFRAFREDSGGVKNRGHKDPHWVEMDRQNREMDIS